MKIQELIDSLQGTHDTFDTELYTLEELKELDSQIFCCENCSWWCEMCEMCDNYICEDCNNEA